MNPNIWIHKHITILIEGIMKNKKELIQELRHLTAAGISDCLQALQESNFDLQSAADIVKKRGLNVVSGREGKIAADGIVSIHSKPNKHSMVEVNCQTDFVANNDAFKTFASNVAEIVNGSNSFSVNDVEDARKELVATTKENVVVRRWWVEETIDPKLKVFTYVHSNKIGVMLTLMASSEEITNSDAFNALGTDLALQVAAMNPEAVSPEHLSDDSKNRCNAIFEAQLKEQNKPQQSWAKILEGKRNKWYTEVCLLEQESIIVPKKQVKAVIADVAKQLNGDITVVRFIRCQVGQGIDVVKDNLAEEVSKMTSKG